MKRSQCVYMTLRMVEPRNCNEVKTSGGERPVPAHLCQARHLNAHAGDVDTIRGQAYSTHDLLAQMAPHGANKRGMHHFRTMLGAVDLEVAVQRETVGWTPYARSQGHDVGGVGARVTVNMANALAM